MNLSKSKKYFILSLVLTVFLVWNQSTISSSKINSDGVAKIVLRDVGHQLLLSNNDSISRILPVVSNNDNKFTLSFESKLSFLPQDLLSISQKKIEESSLQQHYRIEVVQCDNHETAYSTEVDEQTDFSLIPCKTRRLPENCYQILYTFFEVDSQSSIFIIVIYILLLISIILFVVSLIKAKRIEPKNIKEVLTLGIFELHLDQNILIQKGEEISLSKKECEILHVFATQPNQIIKREELMKKVWEDNGVVVSRSLDTYISKLRKKLKNDENIKLINIHGVGYKLEVKK